MNKKCSKCGSAAIYKYGSNCEPLCFNCAMKVPKKEQKKELKQKGQRNEPCPCGSGKKYKYCCINKN